MAVMIGERIRELRQGQGRSLADVAAKAEISVATLSRIENDKQSLELGLFLVLAKVLEISPGALLDADVGAGKVDPLAKRIATLDVKSRTELWREVAAERRTIRARRTGTGRDTSQQYEELLAQVDFVREELETMRKNARKR